MRIMCRYTIVEHCEKYIYIKDQDGPMSITNDAENLVKHLGNLGLLQNMKGEVRDLYYMDTSGDIDTLDHDGKIFQGFIPGAKHLSNE